MGSPAKILDGERLDIPSKLYEAGYRKLIAMTSFSDMPWTWIDPVTG